MSAIYGLIGPRTSPLEPELAAMSAALRHRGPDSDTHWVGRADRAALGFRFLRTSADETNPAVLVNEDRSLARVCDGHVFNTGSLRAWLHDRGHTVGRHSCELLLHLYEEEGVAGWRRADGQFALALWDAQTRRLVLGRDFLGVRTLYYWSRGDAIVFASEIKALVRHSQVPRAVDETAVADFLTFTSVPGPRTLFEGIRKVPAGSAVVRVVDGSE